MTLRKQQNERARVTARFRPKSVNEEDRTVEVAWTTGADVARYDYFSGEEYVERLVVSEDSVNLERLLAGAPVLDSHDRSSVRNTLGVVEDAWIDEGVGVARVRFSERPEADAVWRDVVSGILRKISVGYTQDERRMTEQKDGPSLHEITRWTPYELSFVTVPADNGAQVRVYKEHVKMAEPEKQTEAPAATETREAPPVSQRAENAAEVRPIDADKARAEERARVGYIMDQCKRHALPDELQRELISNGTPVEQCKDRIIDAIAEKGNNMEEIDSRFSPGDGKREADYAEVLSRAAFVKIHPSVGKDLDADARQFAHLPYRELARLAIEADGVSLRNEAPSRLAELIIQHANTRASVTTSVLTSVNANISSRSMLMGYEAVPRTFIPIFRQTTVTNYRPNERVALSDAPVLPVVAEDANYTEVQLSDRKETWVIAKYGHIIKLTREMIVNDDLNAFSRMLQMEGAAAARTENNVVWAILTANGNLSDTDPIFGTGTGTASAAAAGISATTFYAARTAMNAQESEQGQKLGLEPAFVVFNETNRIAVEQLLSPPSAFQEGTIGNVLVDSYRNSLVRVYEPQVGDDNVYFIANNALIDTVEYGWLEGNVGANVATDTVFESDAVRYRVRDEFGAGCVDRRGMYRIDVA